MKPLHCKAICLKVRKQIFLSSIIVINLSPLRVNTFYNKTSSAKSDDQFIIKNIKFVKYIDRECKTQKAVKPWIITKTIILQFINLNNWDPHQGGW